MKILIIIAIVVVSVFIIMYLYGRHRVLNHPLGQASLDLGIPLDELIEYDDILKRFTEDYKKYGDSARLYKNPKNPNHYDQYVQYKTKKEYEESMKRFHDIMNGKNQ